MAQVAVNLVSHEHVSPSGAKRDSSFSSGRGGSGNIRHLSISTDAERSQAPEPGPPSCERQGAPTADKAAKRFTSSGRGGSGNVRPLPSGLEAHPLTASILSQHSAMQAQYEQRVRKLHADSNVVHSSGRGGSGNISDPRRRSRSQEPRTVPKRRFFTTKGRERGSMWFDGQAHDRSDTDKRTSRATCSSGSSGALDARQSEESGEVTSSADVTAGPLPSEDAIMAHSTKRRSFLTRRNKPPSSVNPVALPRLPCSPPPIVPMYPQSRRTSGPGSDVRVHSSSSTSIVLEDREHVSFLEL